ncbi:MAG: nitrilase-related carbon-nitrogen hydrolase [Burkholderiaceae bacterium]
MAAPAHAAGGGSTTDKPKSGLNLRTDGTYPTVELAKPSFLLGVVQTRVRAVDASNPQKGIRENLNHMLNLIDKAFFIGPKPDWLQFHEFPITGWDRWSRAETLKIALDVPGPETEEISKKAKKYGCYITFGSYAKDADWPGHVLSLNTTIGPDGSIVARDWKGSAEDVSGFFGDMQMFTTTVFSVLDRYIEMYGRDAVIPVHRTPLGNFATSQMQAGGDIFQGMAIKGAELILRTATGGFSPLDLQFCAKSNDLYVTMANNAESPDNPHFFDDTGGAGGCAIWGPGGRVLAEANGKAEQLVLARVPIAEFRERHRQPNLIAMELLRDVYNDYRGPFAPNLFSEYIPTSLEDSARYLKSKSRWK